MVFSSLVFLFAFLPLVLAGYFCARSLRARNVALLGFSLLFYWWGEQVFIAVLAASIVVNFGFGLWIDRSRRLSSSKTPLALAVAANLALLGFFKYANFFVANLQAVGLPVTLDAVHLPLGISFFTFQALTYVVDVHRGEVRAQRSLVKVALYIALFPQLIAGPIVRYKTIAARLSRRFVTREGFAEGARRFVVGLGKKVLVANSLAVPADRIFALPSEELTFLAAWLGVACYTLQIYFDFSGYSDMAIGMGRFFGFKLPENFDYPYVATSVREFWRRWHISLSTWFRDYLYIPLGGSRGSTARTHFNLLLVFLLCGLWHGAGWSFVVWGLFHGAFMTVERTEFGRWLRRTWLPLRHLYLLVIVMVAWVFFRAETLTEATHYLATLVGLGSHHAAPGHAPMLLDREVVFWLVVGVAGATPLPWTVLERIGPRGTTTEPSGYGLAGGLLAPVLLLGILVASAAFLAAGTHNPFIYFRF